MTDATTDISEDWRALYDEAYDRFGIRALWSYQKSADPKPEDALAICYSLRTQGDMAARFLAEKIEQACRAA